VLAALLAAGTVPAFHDGGAGSCNGCHIMHEDSVVPATPDGEGALLIAESASDVCLICHATAAGSVLGTDPLVPPPELGAGNFVFLLEDNINDAADGAINPIPGELAGHNVIAPARGLFPSTRHAVSPGGAFPSDMLSCTSCHNPHGSDSFRLLNGTGPVQGGIADFIYPAPRAVGIGLNGPAESNSNHTAYLSGMSSWCANCHGNYHALTGMGGFEHETDHNLSQGTAAQYNRYDGPNDAVGANPANSYIAAVPFEDSANTTISTAGPTGNSRIMCLSCHRAHASSAPHAGRWDFNVSLLNEDGLVSGSHPIPSPYIDPDQGQLCIKCHGSGGVGGRGTPERVIPQPIRPGDLIPR
jgi:hypothetical protein